MVEDIGRYNYNGEIQDKLLEMNKPNLVKIKQKQVVQDMTMLTYHACKCVTNPHLLHCCAVLAGYGSASIKSAH